MNHFLRFYLSSEYKNKINFALTVSIPQIQLERDLSNWGKSFIPNLVKFMKDPNYQRVLDGRPLVYLFQPQSLEENFKGVEQAKNALLTIRDRAQVNGLKDPYLVAMIKISEDPTYYYDLGFDAVTAYTMHNTPQTPNDSTYPYSQLMSNNQYNWERLGEIGPFVPTLNVGWDYRPNLPNDAYNNSPIFGQPTPAQITQHLQNSIEWVKNRRVKVPAQTIYIYSWAEFPEGGWLTPTLNNQDQRLKAVATALGVDYQSPKEGNNENGDFNSDGKVDIFDYSLLLTNFGNPYTIFDYNQFLTTYLK